MNNYQWGSSPVSLLRSNITSFSSYGFMVTCVYTSIYNEGLGGARWLVGCTSSSLSKPGNTVAKSRMTGHHHLRAACVTMMMPYAIMQASLPCLWHWLPNTGPDASLNDLSHLLSKAQAALGIIQYRNTNKSIFSLKLHQLFDDCSK